MKNKKICKEWQQFIKEYKSYFKSNEDIWIETLNEVKKYINDNKIRPSCSDKNANIKKLGWLIGTQQKKLFRKKIHYSSESNIQYVGRFHKTVRKIF